MVRRAYTPEQIINKLREAEALISQGSTMAEASKKIGVTEQTYYQRQQCMVMLELYVLSLTG